jgi:hypothetical protein
VEDRRGDGAVTTRSRAVTVVLEADAGRGTGQTGVAGQLILDVVGRGRVRGREGPEQRPDTTREFGTRTVTLVTTSVRPSMRQRSVLQSMSLPGAAGWPLESVSVRTRSE